MAPIRSPWFRTLRPALALVAALMGFPALSQGDKHEHGVVHLDIAVDGPALIIQMESPLDSVLGFEHRPRNSSETQAVETVLTRLRQGAELFRPATEANCRFQDAKLASVLLDAPPAGDAGKPPLPSAEHQHLDIDASYRFTCGASTRLNAISQALFSTFPRVQRIEVQTASAKGQGRQVLRRPETAIRLPE